MLVFVKIFAFRRYAMIHLIIDADNEKDFDFASILSNKSIKILYTQNALEIQADELTQLISDLFGKLKFNQVTKGTFYLKLAIILAYTDQYLLYDNKLLIELISQETNVKQKTVRSSIEHSLNTMYKLTSIEVLKEVFGESYEGEKLSVKDFVALCVNHLNIVTGKNPINMYYFN